MAKVSDDFSKAIHPKRKVINFDPAKGEWAYSKELKTVPTKLTLPSDPNATMLAYRVSIFDMILFMITCKVHKKVLLKVHEPSVTNSKDKGNSDPQYYFPYFPLIISKLTRNVFKTRNS